MSNKIFLEVYIQPGAKETAVVGLHGDKMKIKIAAPPIDNLANKKLIEFMAKLYKVPKKNVSLVRGEKNRSKLVCIEVISKNV